MKRKEEEWRDEEEGGGDKEMSGKMRKKGKGGR